jgi:hypothetical protein
MQRFLIVRIVRQVAIQLDDHRLVAPFCGPKMDAPVSPSAGSSHRRPREWRSLQARVKTGNINMVETHQATATKADLRAIGIAERAPSACTIPAPPSLVRCRQCR